MQDSSTYNLRIKYGKEDHVLDTETYLESLSAMTTIMKEVNYQLAQTERISISVVAQDTGSFDVGLALRTVQDVFNDNTVQYLAGLATIVGLLIQLRKKDDKIDQSKTEINGDDVTIKDIGGNVIMHTHRDVYNIYTTNQVVQDALSRNFKSLKDDESVTSFEYNDGEIVIVDKSEFEALAKKVEVQLPDREVTEIPANLVIVKVVFEGNDRKWEFLYNGVKIGANVVDDSFWQQINEGKPFAKGDELVADLRIVREYDDNVAAFINKDYQVINVREHHPRSVRQQLRLDDLEAKDHS
jgi:hypothetical protein